ncbi:YlxM family DNA-binding protein [[Clostridium] colinum]|uniref:YlxM family DNA-binding protein n=1 Tax=[Clostridium] colinum TaxID=36835 RepID=UPI0020247EFD|nr:YlxM family DNA-binding protein [[Clostridium] colinum]
MDKILFLTMLYDFYGELLTDKQKEIFELYHLNDLSLYEISSQYNISRQAVLDSIKRTEKTLLHYEEKLSLIEKHLNQKKIIDKTINNIENILSSNSLDLFYVSLLNEIKESLSTLLD